MKKILILGIIFFLIASFTFSMDVNRLTGSGWEQLGRVSPTAKHDIVSGVLSGFGMVKDYAFDLEPKMYDSYRSFEDFVNENDVVNKIVKNLDRYYQLNRDNYKYEDRVVTMIIVIFGKYWW